MINVAIGAIPSWLGAAPLLALAPLATLEIARQSWLYRTAPWPPGAAQRARARELLNLKLWPLVTHTFVQLNLKATVGTLMGTAASTIGLDSDSSIKTALTQAKPQRAREAAPSFRPFAPVKSFFVANFCIGAECLCCRGIDLTCKGQASGSNCDPDLPCLIMMLQIMPLSNDDNSIKTD